MLFPKESIGNALLVAMTVTVTAAFVQQPDSSQAQLARALQGHHVTLSKALTSAAEKGKPISAKYEYEDGKLQLSVYTTKSQRFYEVVLDQRTGKILKTEAITSGEDLDHAKAQSAALATVYGPLNKAVQQALRGNKGYEAVSAIPSLKNGQVMVEVELRKGSEFKTAVEKLP